MRIKAILLLLFFWYCTLLAQQTAPATVMGLYQQALTAKKEQNYSEYLRIAQQLSMLVPSHPGITFLLADAQVLNDDLKSAKKNLLRAANLGISVEPERLTSFQKIDESPEYRKALQLFEKNKLVSGKSEIAFKIPQKDLIAEGIAHDPVSRSFFVSSIYCRKIVEVDASGKSQDFIAEKQDGIWGVLGMEVDPKRRTLWAISSNSEDDMLMKYPEPDTVGQTAIHKYDLQTKKLIKKYVLAVKGERHFFNDLAITKTGDVYITDSDNGSVYRILAAQDKLEQFVKPTGMNYPNGIALSADDSHLYVANLAGISVIDLTSKEIKPVRAPENVATSSIDGMVFYDHSLIANQGLTGVERVARFYLSSDPGRIEKLELLQVNHPVFMLPTTGVIAEDSFYFIANSQLRSFDENKKIFPEDKLQETIILKVKL
ncbi:SMP-30/gluconolactonase/LRE family protein [bacterium]|nr:SMP-30/gluconolactonase/LRE family protein [bacterium]